MKRIFLLGGHDLEMITIREMLDEASEVYFDRSLHWQNAWLSMYQDILEKYGEQEICIYGIELRASNEEALCFSRYVLIDHHNEWAEKPAAIVQVAQILNKPLNRFRQLVAANDSGYIPGMELLEATGEEIDEIRRKDRRAQGVTEEDERLAEEAIAHHTVRYGELIVVESATARFSAICDRLYPYSSLLIHSDKEWIYYGKGAAKVVGHFGGKMKKGTFFYGGGTEGFAGIASGAYSPDEINGMKKEIININSLTKSYENL